MSAVIQKIDEQAALMIRAFGQPTVPTAERWFREARDAVKQTEDRQASLIRLAAAAAILAQVVGE